MATDKTQAHFVDCDGSTGEPVEWEADRLATASWSIWAKIVVGTGILNGTILLDDDYQQIDQAEDPPFDIVYHVHQSVDKTFYSGSGQHTSGDYNGKVVPVKLDANFDPVSGWPAYNTWTTLSTNYIVAARPTNDGQYVYMCNLSPVYNNRYITKLTASTGALVWQVQSSLADSRPFNGWDLGILNNGNVIVPNYYTSSFYGNLFPAILSSSDGSVVLNYYTGNQSNRAISSCYRIIVVETLNMWFGCGVAVQSGSVLIRIGSVQGFSTNEASKTWDFIPVAGTGHVMRGIAYKNGYIYAAGDRTAYGAGNACLWKINALTGAASASADLGFSLQDVFIKNDGTIVAVRNNDTDTWTEIDDDLNVTNQYDKDETPSDHNLWRVEQVPDPIMYGGATVTSAVSQERTLAFPSGHEHLEGETVQILADGAVLPDATVVNGSVGDLSAYTTVHVGLQYTSKLQPMKLDGESTTKRIFKLVVQFFETLGGLFGESEDYLDTIPFRTGADRFNDSPDLFTGHKDLNFDGSYSRKGDLWIEQKQQLPMNVVGVGVKMESNDN